MTLILALAFVFAQPGAESTEVTQELQRIEQRLAATWKAGDCSAWGAMLAADWSVVHVTGAVISKSEALQMCATPAAPIHALEVDDISMRLYGDTAVVRGRTRIAVGGATPGQVRLRFTDVFIRRSGEWQVVASHATLIGS